MCGIVGWWPGPNTNADVLDATCAAMAASLLHRGPDAGGTWLDREAGLALGHRRLAILDLSDAGRQPMASASGRYVITFNGEIYNHLVLREELQQAGFSVSWRGHSDTETLLAALEAWGLRDTLSKLSGMFAFGVWDRREKTLSLARDRMGEKPLYYFSADKQVSFASELKALRQSRQIEFAIDRDAAALFFRYGYVPTPRTIFRNVQKLPPGAFITFSREDMAAASPEKYWSLASRIHPERDRSRISVEDATDQFERLLTKVVHQQMLSDAPLGAFLSGGIDSSLITALMAAGASQKIKSFSIGFSDSLFSEAAHAKAVAQHLGTDHSEVILTERDALGVVPDLAHIFDEPFADSSQIPTALLCRMARQHVTVALSGDGGDEIFGGYNRYVFAPKLWDKYSALPGALRHLVPGLLTRLPTDPTGPAGRAFAAAAGAVGLHGGQIRKLARYGAILSTSPDFASVFGRLVEEWPRSQSLVLGAPEVSSFLDDPGDWVEQLEREEYMMALDTLTYLPDDILVKVDRSAMAASLETRAPFLDHEVVEFAWSLHFDHKIRGGQGKQILRNVLDRHVPRHLIDRPKQGFAVPLDDWLRGPLREWAESLLQPAHLKADGLLDASPITAAWQDHLAGRKQLGTRIWTVLMFQAWRQNFVSGDDLAATSATANLRGPLTRQVAEAL